MDGIAARYRSCASSAAIFASATGRMPDSSAAVCSPVLSTALVSDDNCAASAANPKLSSPAIECSHSDILFHTDNWLPVLCAFLNELRNTLTCRGAPVAALRGAVTAGSLTLGTMTRVSLWISSLSRCHLPTRSQRLVVRLHNAN